MSSPEDVVGDAVERLEWSERTEDESPAKRWKQLTRRTALTGGAAGIAALALEACGSGGSGSAKAAGGSGVNSVFGVSGGYHFTMVNHVTTNVFFTPTQSGAQDACKLLNCSYNWTGSSGNSVSEMVNAINTAIGAGVDGIATTMIAANSFNAPVARALAKGIPVVSYNADEPATGRLAYIGQDLYVAGQQMGMKIKSLVPSGEIAIFIATPGSANIQPRLNGALAVLKGTGLKIATPTSGAAVPAEIAAVNSWAVAHPSAKGLFAVDGGSTQGCAQAIQKNGLKAKGWKGGGFDLTPITQQLLQAGDIEFTIDQQPYLQGFLPILQLFMYKASQGLTGPADVDTGLKFLNSTTVKPYVSTKSEYEGTGTQPGVQKS